MAPHTFLMVSAIQSGGMFPRQNAAQPPWTRTSEASPRQSTSTQNNGSHAPSSTGKQRDQASGSAVAKFVVPVTVMLSFVSFWRASAIVLCDLGSSAYYVGGIAEKAIGKSAPWFILAIMLFSYAVRAIYIESCSMFVRGGVYRVVREAMGGTAAKFSVSALMFDYVLTGPISGVSAGLYLAALVNELGQHFHFPWMHVSAPWFAAAFAAIVTVYFWYTNRVGVPFSSTKALRIMQATTVMVVILIVWCLYTIFTKGYHPVPLPVPSNLHFSGSALGWLKGTALPGFTVVAIAVGLGHSVLALSGEETLAQVYREIEAPKQKNLLRTGFIIFIYSLLFTSLVSFFAIMLIPDAQRARYLDDLIGGLSMFLAGPFALRLAFHCFVVVVGVLILSGAVNTAIIGSNGVLSRVAEDGVLPPWFRKVHPKHGTSHHIIGVIVGLQLLTILLSRGNVDMLGEAYAFGVVWSFAMKGLAVVVLRFKHPEVDRWKFPLNLRFGSREIPIGLIATTGALFLMAFINLFTKKAATISGAIFTLVFSVVFTVSERKYAREQKANHIAATPDPKDVFRETSRERFRFQVCNDLSRSSLKIGEDCALVGVGDAGDLRAVDEVLSDDSQNGHEVVVAFVSDLSMDQVAAAPNDDNSVSGELKDIFSEVVFSAEKLGRPVRLLALPGTDPVSVLLEAARDLEAAQLCLGASCSRDLDQQRSEITERWRSLSSPSRELPVCLVGDPDRNGLEFCLPCAPRDEKNGVRA